MPKEITTKKSNRGGQRIGAGRPKSEETITVSFRVKTQFAEPIKKLVKDFIELSLKSGT